MLPSATTQSFRRRIAIAVAVSFALLAAGAIPRVIIYGWEAAPSSLYYAIVLAVDLGILAALAARWPARPAAALRTGAVLVLATGAGAVLLEGLLSARFPGSMYPAVLYRASPSVALSLVSRLTEAILCLACWTLIFVLPLTLEEARREAVQAASHQRACHLARMRTRLEPALVRQAIADIGERMELDPGGARARLAAFAERLDELADPVKAERTREADARLSEPEPPASPGDTMAMPSPRAPGARRRFALALVAVGSLVALSALARFAEHGWPSLPLEAMSAGRISLELGLFVVLAERAAGNGHSVTRVIAAMALGAIVIGLSVTLLGIPMARAFPGLFYPPSIFTHPTPVPRQLVRAVTSALVDVAFWTFVYLLPLARQEAARRTVEALVLQREAELARLRASLAPHFVRNALNVIAGLVTLDPEEARRLLRGLGDLLAELARDEESHTLAREIAWLRAYGALLEARHPDALSFRFELDPRTETAIVPRLLLQPLVENAVIHGALARDGGGEVRVRVELLDGAGAPPRIRCIVEDDGPGMRGAPREGGLGVRLVRERLAAHAAGGHLSFDSMDPGTRASLELPLPVCQ